MTLAVLGNTPELSALELGVDWEGGQIANISHDVDMNRLGGTVKLANVIDNDIEQIYNLLHTIPTDHKLVFGFSVYAGDSSITETQIKNYSQKLLRLGLDWKKQLKDDGRSVRFVVSKEPALSSVIVTKEHLLKDQTDFVVVLYPDKMIVGRTTAVQNYREFSRLDYGRPQRDAFSGMLPPKVARMMVNIAAVGTTLELSLLDPFCGSGTIIQEALALGWKQVIGSDISEKCIHDTKANIEWLQKQTGSVEAIHELPLLPQLYQHDVLTLTEVIPKHSINTIVTEGYLGPVQPKQPTSIHQELTKFYHQVFPQLAKLLKPRGRLVIALPSWNLGDRLLELPLDQAINQAGFRSFHRPIYYARHTAKVVRKILFLYTWGSKLRSLT